MATGERIELLCLTAELCGAAEFTHNATNIRSIEMLEARAFHMRAIRMELLSEFSSKLAGASLRLLDYAGTRISACFSFPAESKQDLDVEQLVSEFALQTNQSLLEKYRGQLFFCLAAEVVNCSNEDVAASLIQVAARLDMKIAELKQEPFRNQLDQLFVRTESYDTECEFCRHSEAHLSQYSFKETHYLLCSTCSESNSVFADLQKTLAETGSEAGSQQGQQLPKMSLSTPWKKKECEYKGDLKAIFHFRIDGDGIANTSARRVEGRLRNDRLAPILPYVELFELLQKAIGLIIHDSKHSQQQLHESDFAIIECDSRNLVVFGRFFPLIALALHYEALLAKKYPDLASYTASVTNGNLAGPLSLQMSQALRHAEIAKEVGDHILSVNFTEEDSSPASSFKFDEWRGQVRTSLDKIRTFDSMNALGFNFWDYLFDRARSNSTSIYELMYKIARREETHSELRKSAKWQEFKKEIFLALSSQSKNQQRRRQILLTALAWHLYQKQSQHYHPMREFIYVGRN